MTRSRTKKKSSPSSADQNPFEAAYRQALSKLRSRDRFAAELRATLAETFDEETCEAVMDRLVQRGLVNDVRLMKALIEANHGKKAVALDALAQKCAERGASEDAMSLLGQVEEPSMEPLLARFETSVAGRAKAYRYLASRGFSDDDIAAAIARHMPESS